LGESQTETCGSGNCCKLDGTKCTNGSTFIAASCECRCLVGYQGHFCETSSTSADRVIVSEQVVEANKLGALDTTTRAPITYPTALAQTQAAEAPQTENNNLAIYIGAGVGGAVLIGVIAYFALKKKPAPPAADQLGLTGVEGLEGLEGIDLTGMDLSALGMDPNAPPPRAL
jgi:hypothetical protein